MKKLLISCLSILLMSTNAMASEAITFTVYYDDNMPVVHGHPKTPVRPPVVYLDDHTLSFVTGHPDYVLTIKDEDGDVVYTTTVFSAQTEVVLPSTLFGDYEIQLAMGNWLFTGWVTL